MSGPARWESMWPAGRSLQFKPGSRMKDVAKVSKWLKMKSTQRPGTLNAAAPLLNACCISDWLLACRDDGPRHTPPGSKSHQAAGALCPGAAEVVYFINGTFLNKTGLSLFLIRKAQLKQVVIQKVLQEADPWWYFYKEMVLSLLISSCSKLSD